MKQKLKKPFTHFEEHSKRKEFFEEDEVKLSDDLRQVQ